jgi:hypothetical protein
MRSRYLEVTYRNGRPVAAYLYLPRRSGDLAARTERREAGLIVDFAPDGRPIGIEITSPTQFSISALDRVLAALHEAPAQPAEVSPLVAA